MKDENYRPPYIEFDVAHDGSNMPESLGTFEKTSIRDYGKNQNK
jgi:hypothetical protein